MAIRAWVVLLLGVAGGIGAADLSGAIVVEKKLTRRNVTPAAPPYQRGVAVELGSGSGSDARAAEDPLVFERSHVVVYLEGAKDAGQASQRGSSASAPITASIAQEGREFMPDLVVTPVGSTISFPNMDAVFHNVFSLSKPKSFDLGNYPKGQTRTITFPVPGIVYVYCHLHPNMAATIVIAPNRWAVKADGDGHFVLPNVPRGKYTVVAWHKTAGFFRQAVTITEQDVPAIRFLIPLTAEFPDKRPDKSADKSVATSVLKR